MNGEGVCTFQAVIGSGFRARLVGVGSYYLRVHGRSREFLQRGVTEADCRDRLREVGRDGKDIDVQWGACWLPPRYALVTIVVSGRDS